MKLKKIQGGLTASYEDSLHTAWKRKLPLAPRAEKISSSQKIASTWLQGANNHTKLTNSNFVTAALFRLGLPHDYTSTSDYKASGKDLSPKSTFFPYRSG